MKKKENDAHGARKVDVLVLKIIIVLSYIRIVVIAMCECGVW